jgi:hypothetical protein
MLRKTLLLAKNCFFADTNIVIGFQDNKPNIRDFVRDPNNYFYYTETVKDELLSSKEIIDSKFQFFNSGLSQRRKLNALDRLNSLWKDRFGPTHRMLSRFQGLSEDNAHGLYTRNDLFIIFEASNSIFSINLPNENVSETPLLLTGGMKLVNKFILGPETSDLLEKTINLSKFGRLMDVVNLEDEISRWNNTKLLPPHRR